MIVLSCNNISKAYIVDKILDNISFTINEREKIGLVGLNGAGKTTLFNIITGEISKDSGDIYISKDCKIGHLKQHTNIQSEKTVFEKTLEVFQPIISMEKELRQLENEISSLSKSGNSDKLDKLLNTYSKLSEKFTKLNGYGYKSEIRGVLKGLGFEENEFKKPINKLSGGEKTRVTLAKLLLQKPHILLLDEPTNHLDIQAINWLEKYLLEYDGAALIISHDRQFLDSTVSKIFNLENKKLETYTGNYTTYMKKRKEKMKLLQKKYEQQQKEISKQKEIIKRFLSYGGKRYIRQAKSREKMLNKIQKIDKPKDSRKKAKIIFEPKVKSGNDVLKVNNLKKCFDKQTLFENVSFNIYKGEKVGIIGPNGIGKSTLLKIILNKMRPTSGEVTIGHKVNPAYFDQEQSYLTPSKTVVDEIWDEYPKLTHYEIRSMLAQFLFQGEDIFKIIDELSGGEKSRVALLKLMLSKANFLLMDEPTNHLDIDSKEVLEDALINYRGTVLVVSHDRYFLNKVTNKTLDLSKIGIKQYLGNYNYYIEKKNTLLLLQQEDEKPKKTKTQIKAERKKKKEIEKKKRKIKKKIKNLESQITKTEEQIKEIEKKLCSPEIFSDPQKSHELNLKLKETNNNLDELYNKWVILTE